MNYTHQEIARAKELYSEAMHAGAAPRFGVAAMVGISRPAQIRSIEHERSWRDYLLQARRDLRG